MVGELMDAGMNGRTTADIVADLRCIADSDMEGDEITIAEAADRLAELDAERQRFIECINTKTAEFIAEKARHHAAIEEAERERTYRLAVEEDFRTLDALRPPCPTCGGKRTIGGASHFAPSCPDCVDGKVSIEQLVATYNAVWSDDHPAWSYAAKWTRDELRSVKP